MIRWHVHFYIGKWEVYFNNWTFRIFWIDCRDTFCAVLCTVQYKNLANNILANACDMLDTFCILIFDWEYFGELKLICQIRQSFVSHGI